jgi:hypothetical protein
MASWNLEAFDRRDLIALTLDVTVATTRLPCHLVELADLQTWVGLLKAPTVLVGLRADGRVDVNVGASYRGQYVTVHTTADLVRDMALPPHDPETPWASVRLPATEVFRLEQLSGVAS